MLKEPSLKSAFTLIEILIVVAIISIFSYALYLSLSSARPKAQDAQVKSDLQKLKIAFEDYYNDNNCYPPATWFDSPDDCGSAQLAPYLGSIPCDPRLNRPYKLEYVGGQCNAFKLYATLQNPQDPDSVALRSPTGSTLGNYGVSSSNVSVSILYQDPDVPPPPGHLYYYCSSIGNCTSFDPSLEVCTPYYQDDPNCGGSPGSACTAAGSCHSFP